VERRRRAKYSALTGEGLETDEDADIELGEGPGLTGRGDSEDQSTGMVTLDGPSVGKGKTIEEELDNWDENQPDDWDNDDDTTNNGGVQMTPATSSADSIEEHRKKVAID